MRRSPLRLAPTLAATALLLVSCSSSKEVNSPGISAGSSAPQFASTMRPSGVRPYSLTTSSAAMTSIAAPSVICELLPGVTLPIPG